MPSPELAGVFQALQTAMIDSGYLPDMKIVDLGRGPVIQITGINAEMGRELALNIQAGLTARVVRS